MREEEPQVQLRDRLRTLGRTIAVAESCTGGGLASRITDVPGASSYFTGGIVAYQDAAKIQLLNVPEDTLNQRGTVSLETAEAMAIGCRIRFRSDIGVGITGIAGPGGGTPEKPIGLVYIAVTGPGAPCSERFVFAGDRAAIRREAVDAALNMILAFIGGDAAGT
jgi:PncC family amidohydrolase